MNLHATHRSSIWRDLQVAKYGHVKHAYLLIKYGADLHAQNNAGNTPLHVAVSHGQVQCHQCILYELRTYYENFANQKFPLDLQ